MLFPKEENKSLAQAYFRLSTTQTKLLLHFLRKCMPKQPYFKLNDCMINFVLLYSPWQGCHPSSRSSYCQEVTYPLPFSACLLHPLLALLLFFCDALLYLPDRAALPSQLPCLALMVWLLCYLTSLLFFFPKLSPFSHPLDIFSQYLWLFWSPPVTQSAFPTPWFHPMLTGVTSVFTSTI